MLQFEQFLESKSHPTLLSFIKKDLLEKEYAYFRIKTDKNPESFKDTLLQKFPDEIEKIDIDGKELIIFKKVKMDCILYYAKIDFWKDFIQMVDEKDLYISEEDNYGYENKPHITLLYGIHPQEIDRKEVYEWFDTLKSITLKADQIGIFENDKFDVVKLDVKPSKELLKLRKYAVENFPNTQSYDTYHPHMTIAYVKKGEGKKYVKKLKDELEINFDKIVYSDSNYQKKFFNLD